MKCCLYRLFFLDMSCNEASEVLGAIPESGCGHGGC